MSIISTILAIFVLVVIIVQLLGLNISQRTLNIIYGFVILLTLIQQAGWIRF